MLKLHSTPIVLNINVCVFNQYSKIVSNIIGLANQTDTPSLGHAAAEPRERAGVTLPLGGGHVVPKRSGAQKHATPAARPALRPAAAGGTP